MFTRQKFAEIYRVAGKGQDCDLSSRPGRIFPAARESMHGRLIFLRSSNRIWARIFRAQTRDGKREKCRYRVRNRARSRSGGWKQMQAGPNGRSWSPANRETGAGYRTFVRSENIHKWTHVLRFVRLRRNTKVRSGFRARPLSTSALSYGFV